MTLWYEYTCVECHFTMLLPDDGHEIPVLCPECSDGDSLMYVCAREVGRGVYPDMSHEPSQTAA